jgi:hypothetical protein
MTKTEKVPRKIFERKSQGVKGQQKRKCVLTSDKIRRTHLQQTNYNFEVGETRSM